MDYKPGVTRTWGVSEWEWSQPRGKHHWGRDVEHLGMWYEHLDLAVTESIPDFLVNETINSLLLPKPGWTRFLSLTNDVLTQQGEDHCVSCREFSGMDQVAQPCQTPSPAPIAVFFDEEQASWIYPVTPTTRCPSSMASMKDAGEGLPCQTCPSAWPHPSWGFQQWPWVHKCRWAHPAGSSWTEEGERKGKCEVRCSWGKRQVKCGSSLVMAMVQEVFWALPRPRLEHIQRPENDTEVNRALSSQVA